MLKAIIFDFGKVIWIARAGMNARAGMAQAFGVSEAEIKVAIGQHIQLFRTGKISEAEFWKRMGQSLHKPVPPDTSDLWQKPFLEYLDTDNTIRDFALSLKSQGLKVGVLSNNIAPWSDIIRQKGGYGGFDDVIVSCEVGLAKPDPEIYKLALTRLGVPASEVLFIDDKSENLSPAAVLGMQTLLVTDRDLLISQVKQAIDSD